MATSKITIPDFEFSAFYYPQLIDALINYKRINLPELTDESDQEPSIQLLRAFALVGHLNNVLIDIIANESTLPTAQLPETIRNMLRLIGYELRSASPAQTDIVYQLSKVFTSPFQIVPAGAQASTPRGDPSQPVIYFEASLGAEITTPTNAIDFAVTVDGGITNVTTQANNGAGFVYPVAIGAILYFGHLSVMWDKLDIQVLAAPTGGTISGVWEFYDGDFDDTQPDHVSVGGALSFQINSLLGNSNRAGATVRVRLNSSGAFEDCISTWDGSHNVIDTTGLLGQSSPSSNTEDYTVGVDWQELDGVVDTTAGFTVSGTVTWTLPQNEDRNWRQTPPFNVFLVRFRTITSTASVGPTIGLCRLDTGKQYVIAAAVQGRTVPAETLGSSNGAPSQKFTSQHDKFISNSQEVRVDGEAWTQVTNFLNSETQDKHYVVELGESDRATIKFGDGKNGKIPPIGQGNIVMDYRFDAADDGNVGFNTVTVDKQGLTFVEKLWNPRSAVGWAEAQSASTASLEQAKQEGPASLRTKEVALGPDDVVDLTIAFVDSNGSNPFSRAIAIEEAFGPKTIGVVCVARGGGVPTTQQLAELETYFNGDKTANPPKAKHIVANQQVTALAFSPHTFDVVATVYAPADVTAAQVINRLTAVLQPEALKEDGLTFIWEFGGEVPVSRIEHEIFLTDPRITKVVLSVPSIDTLLAGRELPTKGNFTITMVATT